MDQRTENIVLQVIHYMRTHLDEPLTIDDLAHMAHFGKFHFSRVFQEITRVPPGRFLGLLRLAEAKRLLLTTGMSVADVSRAVGYTSIGTFSTRFKDAVGVAPSAFRSTGGRRPLGPDTGPLPGAGQATLVGDVTVPRDAPPGQLFIGLFPGPVPKGRPASCAVLPRPGSFRLSGVPAGRWYLLGYLHPAPRAPTNDVLAPMVGLDGPIPVCCETLLAHGSLHLRPPNPLDAPVVLAPFDLDHPAGSLDPTAPGIERRPLLENDSPPGRDGGYPDRRGSPRTTSWSPPG